MPGVKLFTLREFAQATGITVFADEALTLPIRSVVPCEGEFFRFNLTNGGYQLCAVTEDTVAPIAQFFLAHGDTALAEEVYHVLERTRARS